MKCNECDDSNPRVMMNLKRIFLCGSIMVWLKWNSRWQSNATDPALTLRSNNLSDPVEKSPVLWVCWRLIMDELDLNETQQTKQKKVQSVCFKWFAFCFNSHFTQRPNFLETLLSHWLLVLVQQSSNVSTCAFSVITVGVINHHN